MSLSSVLLSLVLAGFAAGSDLDAIKAEPNLERRSERALENGKRAVEDARAAFDAGDFAKMQTALNEVAESVDVSYAALSETRKSPRKSPKYFKKAEMTIGDMLRRLKSLESDASVEDRPMVQKTERQLHEIRDNIVSGIMSKKKLTETPRTRRLPYGPLPANTAAARRDRPGAGA